jgi:hypothetical protein
MELRRPERFADQSTEIDWHLLAILITFKYNSLARIADFHLVVTGALHHMQQHILQRHILHRNFPLMQKCEPHRGLLDQELRVAFVKTMRLLLQGLQEVTSSTQLKDDVETIGVLKMLLRLHHMLVATHELSKTDFAEWHLTELYGARLLRLCELAFVQHLNGEIPVGGKAFRLVHSTKQRALQPSHQLVLLPCSLDIGAYHFRHATVSVRLTGRHLFIK